MEKIGESAIAEGVKLRLPKARSPSRLVGLWERRKLPSVVWGGAPETEAILNIIIPKWSRPTFLDLVNLKSWQNYVMGSWYEAPMGFRENGVQKMTLGHRDEVPLKLTTFSFFRDYFLSKIIT